VIHLTKIGGLAFVLAISALWPFVARGAVALDGSVTEQAAASDSITFSITVGADADELVVCGGNVFGSFFSLTGATYNGDSLVLVSSAATGGLDSAYMWRLSAPDSGTHDVVLTWDGTGGAVYGYAASFEGVDTGSPVDGFLAGTGSSSSLSKTVTSSAGGMVMDCGWVTAAGTPGTEGAGQTEITNGGTLPSVSSYKSAAGASTAMTWTLDGSVEWFHSAIALKADGGSAPAASDDPGSGYPSRWYSQNAKSNSGWYR
jgi:hypothetical protein